MVGVQNSEEEVVVAWEAFAQKITTSTKPTTPRSKNMNQIGREIGTTKEAEKAIQGFLHIVQCVLCVRALDYHASHSLVTHGH